MADKTNPVETIQFTILKSSLGLALIAKSQKGLVAVLMDDHAAALRKDLSKRFPRALLVESEDSHLSAMAVSVQELIDAPLSKADFPMDARGTAFQRAVWQALREVPPGKTATYSQIADRIGQPRSVRAVAQACAANPISVIIPCHRIVRSDGRQSGYRWGLHRKTALQGRERLKT